MSTLHKDHRDVLIAPVVSEKSYGLLDANKYTFLVRTDVVGKLVEVVSGQKLEEYFRQHIFAPLKMDDTSYNVPEAKGPRLVAQQPVARRSAMHITKSIYIDERSQAGQGCARRRRLGAKRNTVQ